MIRRSGGGGGARGQVNELRGTAAGPVVQARDVHGDLHVHGGGNPLPIPRQLPAGGILVNRGEALSALDRMSSGPRAVVISGPAGIGKTALALHWANGRLGDYPDGQLYADLQGHSAAGPASPGEILGGFVRALGVPGDRVPVALAERAALFRSLTAGRRLLIVLDDAYSAAQVSPLLPGAAGPADPDGPEGPDGPAAVVTSRWRLAGLVMRGARAVQLGPLAPDSALELLDTALGTERVGREREMAGALVELCARSPLALSVAAARLAIRPAWSLADLVRDLADEKRRLAVLSAPDAEDDVTIRAALELSYRALPDPARRLYRALGLFPGTAFDARAAAALAGEPLPDVQDGLGVLAAANLLDDLPGGRHRLHDLARLHALETAEGGDPPERRAEAVRRLVEWTVAAALAASRACAPYRNLPGPPDAPPGPPAFAGAADALDWLDREFGTLRAVARRAHESGLHQQAFLLVDAAWPLFLHRGWHAERLEFDRLGLAAARAAAPGEKAEAKMLNRTGLALRGLGRLDEAAADFRAALALWDGLGDRSRVAGTRRRLGLLELDRDDLTAAVAHFGAALEEYRAAGDGRRTALTLCDLGTALIRDGRPDRAVAVLTEAGRLLDGAADDDAYNRARVLLLLGRAHALRAPGGPSPAADLAARALDAMRSIGSAVGEADALHVLGDLAAGEGRAAEARRHYEDARRVLAEAGAPTDLLDRALAGLGDA
ncbi:tetratricopeptide repeat protein [Spirillospora sp. CA-255316]